MGKYSERFDRGESEQVDAYLDGFSDASRRRRGPLAPRCALPVWYVSAYNNGWRDGDTERRANEAGVR